MPLGYDRLVPALKRRLPVEQIDALGAATGFIRRMRSVCASLFIWAVVLSRFGQGRPGFEQARQLFVRLARKTIALRPFQLRFKSERAVRLCEKAFDQAVAPWRRQRRVNHPLAQHFPDIVAWDASRVQLHDSLRPVFKGLRNAASEAKVFLAISLFGLVPLAARFTSRHCSDLRQPPPLGLFRRGSLLLFDKGFVAYELLGQIAKAKLHYLCPMRLNGVAWIVGINQAPARVRKALQRSPSGVALRDLLPKGKRVGSSWDLQVLVRPTAKDADRTPVSARLVIVPGPKQTQRPYLTSLPTQWSPRALQEMYRLRWQIELVFKELKQDLNLGSVPTRDPNAALVMLWASLIALAISRSVAAALSPLALMTGLRSALRVSVVSRALRSGSRLLTAILFSSGRLAREVARLLLEQILAEAQRGYRNRRDSFARLTEMIPQTCAA